MRSADDCAGLLGIEAELRLRVGRPDRLVRLRLDARSQPDEQPFDARFNRALDLARRVDDDDRACACGRPELFVGFVVAVEDDSVGRDAPVEREPQLAERRDVGAETFTREESQQRDVRKRLRSVDDESLRVDRLVLARTFDQRPLAVHDERRAVLVRQSGRADPAEDELSVFDGGGLREEVEHADSVTAGRRAQNRREIGTDTCARDRYRRRRGWRAFLPALWVGVRARVYLEEAPGTLEEAPGTQPVSPPTSPAPCPRRLRRSSALRSRSALRLPAPLRRHASFPARP